MKSTVRITKLLALGLGASAITGMAALGFGSAVASAQTRYYEPPDPCAAACHAPVHHGPARLNPQPLPPG